MTDKMKRKLESLSIDLVPVPANVTHFFHHVDFTVNGVAKNMMKEFITYYSNMVQCQLENGNDAVDIEVDLRLSTLIPLNA